jgi:hypothetical protein
MKHRQKRYRNVAGLVTLSGLVMGLVLASQYEAPLALANDDKVFSAHFCVPIEETDNTIDAGEAEFLPNRVQAGEDEQRVVCPIMRDIIKGELETVWVRLDNHQKDEDPTECCVIAYDPLGEDSEEECEEADEGKGRQTLEIDGPDAEDNGYYVLTCKFEDEEEAIFSYRISESDEGK